MQFEHAITQIFGLKKLALSDRSLYLYMYTHLANNPIGCDGVKILMDGKWPKLDHFCLCLF